MAKDKWTRREILSTAAMGVGVVLGYGLLSLEGLAFLLPRSRKPRTRLLFAGHESQFLIGAVKEFVDPSGNKTLVRREGGGFEAFSVVCPHLGCMVHWVAEEEHFLCPCHRGIFDRTGKAVAGPPAAAGQSLARVPIVYDEASGNVYVPVKHELRGRPA